jgi:ABC-2 type transport system permease protein
MTLATSLRAPTGSIARLGSFFVQEYLRIMRGRLAKLIAAVMLCMVLAIPFIMERPPKELVNLLADWLGAEDVQRKLVLFVWIDASMNKLAVILGTVLAGGIIVDEKSRGTLDLLLSKPVRAGDYFIIKLAASGAAFSSFYLAGVLAALTIFPWRVPGFSPVDFVALSAVHLFAALFAVAFAGTMAVLFEQKPTGMLVSITVLGTLVSFAFLGFYYPQLRSVSYLNPFFNGIVLIASIDHYGAIDIAVPIAALIGFNVAISLVGRYRATAILERR